MECSPERKLITGENRRLHSLRNGCRANRKLFGPKSALGEVSPDWSWETHIAEKWNPARKLNRHMSDFANYNTQIEQHESLTVSNILALHRWAGWWAELTISPFLS